MKNTKVILGLIAVGALMFFTACTKPGTGGKTHIHGHAHYDANDEKISGAVVSIWYDASSKSGDADDATTTDAEGEFEFENLTKGDYYLFASGADSSGTAREGGLAVTIKKKSGEVEADIDVE